MKIKIPDIFRRIKKNGMCLRNYNKRKDCDDFCNFDGPPQYVFLGALYLQPVPNKLDEILSTIQNKKQNVKHKTNKDNKPVQVESDTHVLSSNNGTTVKKQMRGKANSKRLKGSKKRSLRNQNILAEQKVDTAKTASDKQRHLKQQKLQSEVLQRKTESIENNIDPKIDKGDVIQSNVNVVETDDIAIQVINITKESEVSTSTANKTEPNEKAVENQVSKGSLSIETCPTGNLGDVNDNCKEIESQQESGNVSDETMEASYIKQPLPLEVPFELTSDVPTHIESNGSCVETNLPHIENNGSSNEINLSQAVSNGCSEDAMSDDEYPDEANLPHDENTRSSDENTRSSDENTGSSDENTGSSDENNLSHLENNRCPDEINANCNAADSSPTHIGSNDAEHDANFDLSSSDSDNSQGSSSKSDSDTSKQKSKTKDNEPRQQYSIVNGKRYIRGPPYCKICSKMFTSYRKLVKHRAEHEGENPYKCLYCPRTYAVLEDLTAHLRHHQGKLPYKCKKCNKEFKTLKECKEHEPVHVLRKTTTVQKNYTCDVCKRNFKKFCDLERHTRVHTGEKPAVCNICNKRFQQTNNLTKHLLIHIQAKPFECEVCGKSFSRSDVLNRHILTHSLVKPHHCSRCNKSFIRTSQLDAHIRKHH